MTNRKCSFSSRLLASVMALIMMLSLIPLSLITALAATTVHPDAITITVVDNDGAAVQGATVNFLIDSVINGNKFKTGKETTDANGTIEVMPSADYVENDLTITAVVSKEHYKDDTTSISNIAITSNNQDFGVTLISTLIDDVTVTATSVAYDGKEHAAATVSGIKADDTVSYKLNNGKWQSEMPTISAPYTTYSLMVKVVRADFEDFTITVTPVISLNTISLDVVEYSGNYDKESHPALTITGLLPTDTVTYKLNGGDATSDIPSIINSGTYTVAVHVERYGYNNYDKTFTNVEISATTIDGLSAVAYTKTYDGQEHNAVNVSGAIDGDIIKYQLNNGTWTDKVPTIKSVGNYVVKVKVTRTKYLETNVDVLPANAYISKADQTLSFTNTQYTDGAEGTVTFDKINATNNVYNFKAKADDTFDDDVNGNAIVYSIENATDDGLSIENIATINTDTGEVTVKAAGVVIIKATRLGNDNYNNGEITYTLTITFPAGNLVSFSETNYPYIIGTYDGTVSKLVATMSNDDDNGKLTYSIDKTDIGLSIKPKTGKVTVTDFGRLAEAMTNNNGNVSVIVTANKSAGTKWIGVIKKEVYAADKATYIVNISFLDTPATPYTLKGTKGENGWYTTDVVASATDSANYTISKTCEPNAFGTSVTYSDQGVSNRYVYLRNTANGGITNQILLDGVKIDTVKPDYTKMSVSYSKSITDTVLGFITLGFYKPSVTLTFTAEDVTSGVAYFTWNYTKQDGASSVKHPASILDTKIDAVQDTSDKTKFTAQIVLTAAEAAQYRGYISFTATDNAGNMSVSVDDKGNVFVVDTISPTLSVKYAGAEPYVNAKQSINGVNYFNGDVEVELTITEANFYSEDLAVVVTKDGQPYDYGTVNWGTRNEEDKTVGNFTLAGDGDYVVTVNATDKSGNLMDPYTSETITVDKTAPVLNFTYNGAEDQQEPQSTTFTVTEHNFRAEDISVTVDAKDITGADVTAKNLEKTLREAKWTNNGDVYTTTVSDYVDAIYNITIAYTDISGNVGVDGDNVNAQGKICDKFIIDHTAPENVDITYSDAYETPWDTIVNALTLGFYNPKDNKPVTVTFTTHDYTSGVDHFTWSYNRTDGVSETNVEKYIDAKISGDDVKQNGNTFTASVTLPKEVADQLRGSISASATDNKANTGTLITDSGKVIVVDSISPTMTVEYSESSRTVGTNMYYNKAATATFTVTEANFFNEDVKVTVSKNGETAYPVTPTWVDTNVDVHIGTVVLPAASDNSNDGHYVINVTYNDRSNNIMTSYASDIITIDTINPTVNIVYSNTDIKNTLEDSEGNSRKYFGNTQTATITVNEHNFNADEVSLDIVAKDVTGTVLENSNLISKSAWADNGDNHTIVITYSGDANYTFDVAYTDLATNVMADYSKDYFTVDKTAPTNLTVSYSTSVLDTVLESITFGFYNAKMTVMITAEDATTKINNFDYSYIKAAGVSAVNAELLKQTIAEAGITYLNDDAKATTTFEIPKMVLGNDNQFNGTVEFIAKDRSENSTEKKDTQRIVVDNIAPTATISYNEPVNSENGISYYAGNISATINITEATFYSTDVSVMISKDGASATAVATNWTDNSVDSHTGTFTLIDDGDYVVSISYKDKSNNQMVAYTSNQLTIDTKIDAPTITINGSDGNGKAYKNNVIPAISFNDQNYDNYEVTLTQTRYGNKNIDVKNKFIGTAVGVIEKGGSGSFDTFEKLAENDGVYTLTVKMTDKAKHDATTAITFTVNRFGSVYEYSNYLVSLIKDGGQYITVSEDNKMAITDNLVITEYNAERLLSDSVKILITRDGKAIEAKYESTPAIINAETPIDESGWYQYMYTIDKANFAEDGVYKISLTSAYATNDSEKNDSTSVPDNSIDENGNKILDSMNFTVDTTAPEIRNIVNLDKAIADKDQIVDGKITAKYTIIDVGGLKSIEIIVNGKTIDTISEFGTSANNYSGEFVLNEDSHEQTVQLKVTDLAGNVTDTSSKGFNPGELYVFNDHITVSTNFFVRWYANTPLFWGSIGGVILLVGIVGFIIAKKHKKAEA